jgi:hypothetical protein
MHAVNIDSVIDQLVNGPNGAQCQQLLNLALAAQNQAVFSNTFETRAITARDVLMRFLSPGHFFAPPKRKEFDPSIKFADTLQLTLEKEVINVISEPLQDAAATFNGGQIEAGVAKFERVLKLGWQVLQKWFIQPAHSRRYGTLLEDMADVYLQANEIHAAAGAFMMCMRQIEPLDNFARDIYSIIRCRRMTGYLFHKLGYITEALYWKIYELRLAVSLGDRAIYDCLIVFIPVYLVWMNDPQYVQQER